MAEILRPDICVIGAGSGGLSLAAAAATFGVSVVLIEKGRMGGDCLNYGCVPSKALIAAARHARTLGEGHRFGIADVEPDINFRKVHDAVHAVIAEIAPNDSGERFAALGVRVIHAAAKFSGMNSVVAGDHEIRARRFVIATGSSPLVPPIPGIGSVEYLTNETIFGLTRRPRHLIIIGGGPVGMELAQAHRRLGSQVTVIEAARALGREDPELAGIVLDRMRAEGVIVHEGATVTGAGPHGQAGVSVTFKTGGDERTITGSHLLVAAGRVPNVLGLDLEKAKIAYGPKGVRVERNLRTTNRRVYAIGDVAGTQHFTHVANYHAALVARAILFRLAARVKPLLVPLAIFTDPEIAHVGMSEETARKTRRRIRVLRWPYAENDGARAQRRTAGFIKIVTDRWGRILGVSIVGAGAGEMIGLWTLAMARKLKVADIAALVLPYPTMAEIGKRAAISYLTPMAAKTSVRLLIGLLRKFG